VGRPRFRQQRFARFGFHQLFCRSIAVRALPEDARIEWDKIKLSPQQKQPDSGNT